VLRLLGDSAPEADLTQLHPARNIRAQLDLDSMDCLNFVIALDKELHLAMPETESQPMATVNDWVAYLAQKGGPS
jgi:acyl carrier protein